MPAIQYLLESAFCLACLYAFYWATLRRQTFFQWNRAYLMLAPVLALLIPALTIRFDKPAPSTPGGPADWPALVEYVQTAPQMVQQSLQQPVWALSLGELLWWIYLLVAAVLAVRLLVQVGRLAGLIRRYRGAKWNNLTVVSGPGDIPAASFFGYLFWPGRPGDGAGQDLIFEHELTHARQWHSLDLLWMEALIVLQWFNPLLYAYRQSLRAVHEYIADDYVVRRTRQRYEYATLLTQTRRRTPEVPGLVNTFHSLIKNRLTMLAKQPSHPLNRFCYLPALLLCLGLMGLFSFRMVDRIPLFTPLKTALETAEQYAGTLREVTITSRRNTALEPTPYIFYWGPLSCRIEKDPATGKYQGQIQLQPHEFRSAVNREPRLWNGQSVESYLSFDLKNISVVSDYNNQGIYGNCRQKISNLAYDIQPGDRMTISGLSLPDGNKATVALWFDTTPAGAGPTAPTEINWSEPGNNTTFADGSAWGYFLWGQQLNTRNNDRNFFTAAEILDMIESAPQHYRENGEPSNLTQCSLVLLPSHHRDAVEINFEHDRTNLAVYAKHKQRLHELLKEALQQSALIYLDVNVPGFPPISGGTIRVVDDNHPALNLRTDDLHKFTFEWGAFASAVPDKFGRAYPDAGDNMISVDLPSRRANRIPVEEVRQILDLTPRFWEDDLLLKGLQFQVQYKDAKTVYDSQNGLPGIFKQEIREKLRIGDTLILTNFIASGRYLTRHTIDIIAGNNDPKPPLVRNTTIQPKSVRLTVSPNPAGEQATVNIMLPEAGAGALTVTDATGVVQYSLKTDFHAGYTPFALPLKQMHARGLLYLRLDMPYGSGQTTLVVE